MLPVTPSRIFLWASVINGLLICRGKRYHISAISALLPQKPIHTVFKLLTPGVFMTISNWPKEDRPREKLLLNGEKSLTDAELIAIFLKTGIRGKTAVDIARELLLEHGSLKKLLSCPPHVLTQKRGLGHAKYAALKAAMELGRRYLQQKPATGMVFSSSKETRQYLASELREHSTEVFACLFLDNQFRLICFEKLFFGTVNEASIYPREVVRRALLHNASNLILAHNHPSGNPRPSVADKEITTTIRQALNLVDICVLDHVIIGNPANFSFVDAGIF
jgi:DNA repair protein RadC